MSGAIMQIVAYGSADVSINQINNVETSNRYAHEPTYFEFQNTGLTRQVRISRIGDQWKPEYIVMEQSDEEIRLKRVYLIIGGQIVMNFDINFMRQLFPDMVRIRNNKVVYHLNFDKFNTNSHLNIVSLQFHEVQIGIELTNDHGVNSVKLMNDYKFLDHVPRSQMAQNNHEHIILEEQHIETECDGITAELYQNMNGPTNGFFIHVSSGIENIKNLKIELNNTNYRDLDEIQLEYLGQIINENMIYLPLSPNTDYLSTDISGSLNMSRIQDMKFKITGETALGYIRIHALTANILAYQSGMGGIRYTHTVHSQTHVSYSTSSHTVTVTIINKVYTGDDDCLISLLEIEDDMHYMECGECRKAFIKEHLDQWLNNSRTCPHCRKAWTSNQVYKNAQPPQLEVNEESDNIEDVLEIEEDEPVPVVTRSAFGGFLSRVIPFIGA